MEALHIFSGFFVGVVVGMTGVGGGSLMTPLLVLLFGVAPITAVGTDLLFAAFTKAGGSWSHARRGNVAWDVVGWLALGSVPAAVATLELLPLFVGDHDRISAITNMTLGIALILTAGALLFREKLLALLYVRGDAIPRPSNGPPWRTLALGVILGILVSLSSVGAGALGVTALLVLHPGLAAARVVGTDIAHAVPLTLVAGLGHAANGAVDWTLLGTLLLGSLPGIWLGSSLGRMIPEHLLRRLLASMLVLVGGRLIW